MLFKLYIITFDSVTFFSCYVACFPICYIFFNQLTFTSCLYVKYYSRNYLVTRFVIFSVLRMSLL